LKYVDVYRYSDGVALIGHRHNRPGADNSALAPRARAFPNVAGKAGPTVRGAKARVHMPACLPSSFPGLFSRWTGTFDARDLWVMRQVPSVFPYPRNPICADQCGWAVRVVTRDCTRLGTFRRVLFPICSQIRRLQRVQLRWVYVGRRRNHSSACGASIGPMLLNVVLGSALPIAA
jgi:hypothetical protein